MKILCWNMGAAFGFRGPQHDAAWEWLNGEDADVVLLQEVVRREEHLAPWASVVFTEKWQNWGSAVLVRDGGYEPWTPGLEQPWLRKVRGAVSVARPTDPGALWLVSVHSDASFEATERRYPGTFGELPSSESVARCSSTELWEIEVIAHELAPVLVGKPFLLGGDLNSALMFDSASDQSNARLFANLRSAGLADLRPRHAPDEVQTFFRDGSRPFQLDHVFADAVTEAAVSSWAVRTEVVTELGLSDHAPVEVVLG